MVVIKGHQSQRPVLPADLMGLRQIARLCWSFGSLDLDPQLGYESKNRTLRSSQWEKALY